MRLTVGKQLGIGFGLVLGLMVLSAVVVYVSIARMNASVVRVTDRTFPTVRACDEMLNGLNHSVAALRGYLLMGDDRKQNEFFKQDRQKAWTTIDQAMIQLESFYRDTTDPEDRKHFAMVQTSLEALRKVQQNVEDLGWTDENIRFQFLLRKEGVPAAEKVFAATTALIEGEEGQEGIPERRKLLKQLVDFRGSFLRALTHLQAYLLTSEAVYRTSFQEQWQLNQRTYKQLIPQGKLQPGKSAELWDELKRVRDEFAPLPQQLIRLRDADDWNQANYLNRTQARPKGATITEAVGQLKQAVATRVAEERRSMEAASTTVTTTLLLATLLAIMLGSAIAIWLSRKLVRALLALLAGVQRVGAGDLQGGEIPVQSRDEIGDLAVGFNQMVGSLRGILAEIAAMTTEVAVASRQIATGAQQQLTSLNETAASLNQITTTAEEFKTTMQEFADRARAVKDAAGETARRAADGQTLTQDSTGRIDLVRSNSQGAGESVLNLSEQMQRIGEITATVHEIAEQTKLLALNASIEAARAGDNGRGFAVVATQVRELANQSKDSAGRIEALIADTQKSMQQVVGKIHEGSRLSDHAVELVRRVTEAFGEITQATEQTRDAMAQITAGSRQQEQGISQLVSSITEIDAASRESVASAEQTQRSIVAIDRRIQSLNTTIARFKTV